MFPLAAKLGEVALNFLFPHRCIGCGREGELICSSCLINLPRIVPPVCPRCGRPQSSSILCPDCVKRQSYIDGIRSSYRFEGVIRQAIHQFKYRNLRSLATPLAQLISNYLKSYPIPGDILIPVPIHKRRMRERGYNQSLLLAKKLGKLTDLPAIENCLVRRIQSPPQARSASVEERHSNVAYAFVCNDSLINGRQVLLIDDVATSGATLDACAKALKATGASSVWGLTLAREI
jgi:ComF family protein